MSTLTEYQALIGDRSHLAGGVAGLTLAIADDAVWEQRMAQRAAVYLYVRGLLELVPGHPGWVRITPNPKDAVHG